MQFKLLNVLGNKFSYCCLHFSYHRRDDALLKRRAKNEIMDVKRSSNNQLFLFVCWFHNVYGAKVFLKTLKKTALFACYFIHSTQPCSDYVKKEAFARITQKKVKWINHTNVDTRANVDGIFNVLLKQTRISQTVDFMHHFDTETFTDYVDFSLSCYAH
mgnify:CR=1 FL=1